MSLATLVSPVGLFPIRLSRRESKVVEAALAGNSVLAIDQNASGNLCVERVVDMTLTPAQLAAAGTAVELIAAPGADLFVQLDSVEVLMTYGTAAMTESSAILDVQYDTAGAIYTMDATGLVTISSATKRVGSCVGGAGSSSANTTIGVNEAIQLKIRSGTITAGTSTGSFKIRLRYRLRSAA
jgi:hypothetical protein